MCLGGLFRSAAAGQRIAPLHPQLGWACTGSKRPICAGRAALLSQSPALLTHRPLTLVHRPSLMACSPALMALTVQGVFFANQSQAPLTHGTVPRRMPAATAQANGITEKLSGIAIQNMLNITVSEVLYSRGLLPKENFNRGSPPRSSKGALPVCLRPGAAQPTMVACTCARARKQLCPPEQWPGLRGRALVQKGDLSQMGGSASMM